MYFGASTGFGLHFSYVPLNERTSRPPILPGAMRRTLCFAMLAALLVPAAALAERDAPTVPGDGTLSVRNGDGTLRLEMRGVALGRMTSGVIEVLIPLERDCSDLNVAGAEGRDESAAWVDEDSLVWVCKFADRRGGLRFRLSGQQTIRFKRMRNLNMSVVGRGSGRIRGTGDADGTYSLNGDDFVSLPDDPDDFVLGAPRNQAVPAKRPE
jgi:hypothetical protein